MRLLIATSSLYRSCITCLRGGFSTGLGCADMKLCSHITECAAWSYFIVHH